MTTTIKLSDLDKVRIEAAKLYRDDHSVPTAEGVLSYIDRAVSILSRVKSWESRRQCK